jgi:hypothetical protein
LLRLTSSAYPQISALSRPPLVVPVSITINRFKYKFNI